MYPGCVAVANFYFLFVSSPAGVVAFYDANSDRCACPCNNPSVEVFCRKPGTQHEVECRNVRKSDNNNCGGCDWTCPYKTHCGRDTCQCDDDRCGNVYMNLRSHPNNCGRCGNRCASGFCWQGMCYDPPENPEFCIPGQGLVNGYFPNDNGTGWSNEGSWTNTRLTFAADSAVVDMWPGTETWEFGGGYMSTAVLKTTARLCPGETYDLTFRVRQTWTGSVQDPGCVVGWRIGDRSWLNDPSQSFILDTNRNWWTQRGPIRISPFQEGQGTVVNNVYLGVEVIFDIVCLRIWGTVQAAFAEISIHPA